MWSGRQSALDMEPLARTRDHSLVARDTLPGIRRQGTGLGDRVGRPGFLVLRGEAIGTGKGALPMDADHTMGLYVGTRGPVYLRTWQ